MQEQSGWREHAAFTDGLVAAGFFIMGGPLADNHRVVIVVNATQRIKSVRRWYAIRGARLMCGSAGSRSGRSSSTDEVHTRPHRPRHTTNEQAASRQSHLEREGSRDLKSRPVPYRENGSTLDAAFGEARIPLACGARKLGSAVWNQCDLQQDRLYAPHRRGAPTLRDQIDLGDLPLSERPMIQGSR
jgi:hypothetical protein